MSFCADEIVALGELADAAQEDRRGVGRSFHRLDQLPLGHGQVAS